MWNIDNPKKEKTVSLYKELQEYILSNAVSGKKLCDLFEGRGYTRKAISSLARTLFQRNKVERTKFKTKEGHIYGKSLNECLEYGVKERLLPISIKAFFKIMVNKGFITNQQLIYEFGFELKDIDWFRRCLIKQHYFNEKVVIRNKLYIFYCGGLNPRDYRKTKEYKKWREWVKDFPQRIKKEGAYFEDVVEKIYKKLGYNVTRNRWYKTEKGSFEVDIVAWKEEIFGIRTIYVSCKRYKLSVVTSYDLLRMVVFRRLVKGDYGEVHIWGWNRIARSVFNSIRAFPFVRLFYKKDLISMCHKLKIKIPRSLLIKNKIWNPKLKTLKKINN